MSTLVSSLYAMNGSQFVATTHEPPTDREESVPTPIGLGATVMCMRSRGATKALCLCGDKLIAPVVACVDLSKDSANKSVVCVCVGGVFVLSLNAIWAGLEAIGQSSKVVCLLWVRPDRACCIVCL